jgi:hypothetical protein
MKLRPFICMYSAALLAWLGLTFVTPQPAQRYRPSDADPVTNATPKPIDQTEAANSKSEREWIFSSSR